MVIVLNIFRNILLTLSVPISSFLTLISDFLPMHHDFLAAKPEYKIRRT